MGIPYHYTAVRIRTFTAEDPGSILGLGTKISWHSQKKKEREHVFTFSNSAFYSDNMEKEMATDFSILAWETLWPEEPGG